MEVLAQWYKNQLIIISSRVQIMLQLELGGENRIRYGIPAGIVSTKVETSAPNHQLNVQIQLWVTRGEVNRKKI